jgi:hypothetical protein
MNCNFSYRYQFNDMSCSDKKIFLQLNCVVKKMVYLTLNSFFLYEQKSNFHHSVEVSIKNINQQIIRTDSVRLLSNYQTLPYIGIYSIELLVIFVGNANKIIKLEVEQAWNSIRFYMKNSLHVYWEVVCKI